ncbi:putative secreted protein [Sorangium cellulosum So ce56]|uniref:Secreted protein n=1 Tax=Sorangium cellulosum (strain So ce56) TaxID=448385 RepID=A9GG01_SORC5|nr:hypothetical protein [Sorangium cellulosum]CAN96258.1 putative secreted protein [Sorangium cellulosum So ce56]
MNIKGILLPIVAVLICVLAACNWTVGDCYPREEWERGAGAGGPVGPSVPVITSVSSGDFGDAPPSGSQYGSERKLQCNKTDDEDEEESPSDSSERPTGSPTSPPDPCPGIGDIPGDGATFLSCSEACSSKCPPGMAHFRYVNFDPSDFPFVTTVQDDGRGKAGGYQEAKANLKFTRIFPGGTDEWYCSLTIKMPLRTELMGKIDPLRAANLSEEITEEVGQLMDYNLPPGIFCERFRSAADAAFKLKYTGLGASVTK